MMSLCKKGPIKFSVILILCFAWHVAPKETKDSEVYDQNVSSFNVEESGVYAEDVHLNQSWLIGSQLMEARQCNLFAGSWVHDESYPLYSAAQCPYIDSKLDCRGNGRPDSDYEKWRWKPFGCTMPRFNAMDMLERLRGKRLMFVGDSTNRNQWESMVCLLSTVIPNDKKSVSYGFPLRTFKALDYEASIEYFWAPFLVEQEINMGKKILHVDSIQRNGVYWKGVDVLIFETSHWWTHSGTDRGWDMVQIGHHLYGDMDPMVAYRKGLSTWANWISSNIDPQKSMVFFRTMSPQHYSDQWNGEGCYNQMEPVKRRGYLPPLPPQVPILEYILKKTRFPVQLLDITKLSGYRIDGHPSVYGKVLSNGEWKNPQFYTDCSHWCLPGVPDTWNELLYASLVIN